ncbi:MAG: phosphopyruvate hydratase [Candidatus Beckwithbacteria bacterium]|nr:phosphopyruvate hydratase [Candidatus Beckwithbacteria bacterium]
MAKIISVKASEILDSRGNPTIQTCIKLDTGQLGTASIPSGASVSKYEALELRDNDLSRFSGLGVLKAVANVNIIIAPKIIGLDPSYQTKIDQLLIELDGTTNKSRLGGNALLSVSIACLKAAAAAYNLPVYLYLSQKYGLVKDFKHLPTPTFNIINGGAHGAGNLDFQEFHIIPSNRFAYHEALQIGIDIYKNLKKVLIQRQAIHSVGDEGGYAPNLFTNLDALQVILEAIKLTPYKFTQDVFLGLDVSAGYFFHNNHYQIKDRAQSFNRLELITYYLELNREYRLFFLEDALFQDDWEGWTKLTEELGETTLIVGDDLLTTNKERVKKAINLKACNAILVKPNQIGTVSETVEVVKYCRENQWKIIVSHRSGETNDTFIADLAVGLGADYTKFGAPSRGERIAKYNRLLEIANEQL